MQANRLKHVRTFLIGYRSGGTPGFHTFSGRVTELRAVDEGAVPTSAPATSRLFVLPVAARRLVSTDNNDLVELEYTIDKKHLHRPYTVEGLV